MMMVPIMGAHRQGRAKSLLSVLALGVALLGCQETVSFNVLRAARVNVKGMAGDGKDATVSMGQWGGVDGSAASDISQRIRELVTNSEGGVVKFTEAQGTVRLDGTVQEHIHSEKVSSKTSTCSKTDPNNSKKTVQYQCTTNTREGAAKIRVSLNVIDSTGKTVASDSFAATMPMSTSATDEEAPSIDWDGVLSSLRGGAAAHLARLVVPFRVLVSKRWFKCGDANETCKGGLVQLRQGNFDEAQVQFKKAVDQLHAMAKPDPEAEAAAWWGITLAQEFSGDYTSAKVSLEKAVSLDPKQEVYAAEQRSIRQEEENAKKLVKQGVEK